MEKRRFKLRSAGVLRFERLVKKILFLSLLFFIIAFILFFVSGMEKFAVAEITVTGATQHLKKEIEKTTEGHLSGRVWGVFSRRSVFFLGRKSLKDKLLFAYPSLRLAEASTSGFNSLKIDVVVRAPAYLYCRQKGNNFEKICYSVDSSGFIFEPVIAVTRSFFVFSGGVPTENPVGRKVLPSEFFSWALSTRAELKKIGVETKTGEPLPGENYRLVAENDFEVKTALKMIPAEIGRNTAAVMEIVGKRGKTERLSYVDLRFPPRVYFKTEKIAAAGKP